MAECRPSRGVIARGVSSRVRVPIGTHTQAALRETARDARHRSRRNLGDLRPCTAVDGVGGAGRLPFGRQRSGPTRPLPPLTQVARSSPAVMPGQGANQR
jgi:hypothetical protein